jgi:hypothetical protein
MGGLFGGGKSTSTTDQVLAGIQIQTSSYGGVLPIVYGTSRIPGNLVDYDDFTPIPHTTTIQTGKGGGGSSVSNTTYTYTAGVILALCEGPITAINQVWRDKEIGSLSGYGFTFYQGTRPQTAWPTWGSKHPTKAIGYNGMALICHAAIDLGGSGAMKNHSFEVIGLLATQQDPNATAAYDAKPSDIIPDFLTNPYYGAGWNLAQIADLVTGAGSYATYCQAMGFVLSPAFTEQKPAAAHLQELLDATNSESVWTAGSTSMTLKIVPYGDQPLTANGTTFTPNTTPLYDLGVDDFLVDSSDEDPITVSLTSPQDVKNCVPVEFLDRLNDYNTSILDDPEPVDVAQNGTKKDSPIVLHSIARAAHALQISRIRAQRNVNVRRTYTFRVGWKYILLEPMVDLVTLTEPFIGLDHKVCRIKSVEIPDEGTEDQGLTIEAEEWPFGTGTATLYTTQTSDGTAPNVNADPGNTNTPVIFDVPVLYRNGADPEMMIAASGGALWGGCEIWVSADGATYAQAGQITAPARHGVLTANMATGAAQNDTTSNCAVDLSVSKGSLQSVPAQVATDKQSLCWCDGELFSYQTATLTSANAYTLGTLLVRGLYGTAQASHVSGKAFTRVDAALARMVVPESRVGQLLYIKLVSVNIWGGGKQSLASVPAYTFTPGMQVLPTPYNVTIAVSSTRPA